MVLLQVNKKCVKLFRIILVHEAGVAEYYLSIQNKKHEARF